MPIIISSLNKFFLKKFDNSFWFFISATCVLEFLDINKEAKYFTDVISDEIEKKDENLILQAYNKNKYMDRLIITPHIGGMTHDARFLAYNRAADLLIEYFKM